jgi:hypothetical protein
LFFHAFFFSRLTASGIPLGMPEAVSLLNSFYDLLNFSILTSIAPCQSVVSAGQRTGRFSGEGVLHGVRLYLSKAIVHEAPLRVSRVLPQMPS